MVEVIYNGNLGNNLFQYCFGRILAEELGYRLVAAPIPGFPRTRDLVDGRAYPDGEPITLRGQKPDLTFLTNPSGHKYRLLLTGFFQRYHYYRNHKQRIREWLHVPDTIEATVGNLDVVLSIRRGVDYIPAHGLPLSYYEEALALAERGRIHICTNEPTDPFIRHLERKYRATVRPGSFKGARLDASYMSGALDNFMFIRKFRSIVVSNSSFAWWAAFLSDADQIIFPRPAKGMWAPMDPISRNIDLEVDESRYTYLMCEPYRSEFLGERLRVAREEVVQRTRKGIRALLPPSLRRSPPRTDSRGFSFLEEPED